MCESYRGTDHVEKKRVVIAEDHKILRQGLRSLLSTSDELPDSETDTTQDSRFLLKQNGKRQNYGVIVIRKVSFTEM
jgi:DNA-binding NarL/FixJ family response regulator